MFHRRISTKTRLIETRSSKREFATIHGNVEEKYTKKVIEKLVAWNEKITNHQIKRSHAWKRCRNPRSRLEIKGRNIDLKIADMCPATLFGVFCVAISSVRSERRIVSAIRAKGLRDCVDRRIIMSIADTHLVRLLHRTSDTFCLLTVTLRPRRQELTDSCLERVCTMHRSAQKAICDRASGSPIKLIYESAALSSIRVPLENAQDRGEPAGPENAGTSLRDVEARASARARSRTPLSR